MTEPQASLHPDVAHTLKEFTDGLKARHGKDLVGLYLHGSLAMGSYVPGRSDVDLLVVRRSALTPAARRQELSCLLKASADLLPGGMEISYLVQRDLTPLTEAPPFDLHYGESHRDAALRVGEGGPLGPPFLPGCDGDLPGHLVVIHARGRTLVGVPAAQALPRVPREIFLTSIVDDLSFAMNHLDDKPDYAVLNACRTLLFLRTGKISSKAEGGKWAMETFTGIEAEIVKDALSIYQGEPHARMRVGREDLAQLLERLHAEIRHSA